MQTSTAQIYDPAKAKAYFEAKLAFTTGPVELEQMIKADDSIVIVDVRAPEDYASGHVPGAINMPKGSWNDLHLLSRANVNVVYCYSQTCHLGALACVAFANNGYPVMEMEGGFEAWQNNKLDFAEAESGRE